MSIPLNEVTVLSARPSFSSSLPLSGIYLILQEQTHLLSLWVLFHFHCMFKEPEVLRDWFWQAYSVSELSEMNLHPVC